MKLLGDVPESHRQLAKELEQAELYWDEKSKYTDFPELVSKAYVCLAHDWYQIGEEDQGALILQKAEKVCPGYFKNVIQKHTEADEDFNYIVRSLTTELIWVMAGTISGTGK